MVHNSWDGVINEIKQYVKNALQDDVARMVYSTIQEYLLSTVYAKTPEIYQRTFEVLRALTVGVAKIEGNSVSVEIYIDSSKIIPYKTEDGWNSHMSFNGSAYNEELPYALEFGTSGNTPYITPNFQYMSKSKTEIEDRNLHIQRLQGYLKTKGLECIIT